MWNIFCALLSLIVPHKFHYLWNTVLWVLVKTTVRDPKTKHLVEFCPLGKSRVFFTGELLSLNQDTMKQLLTANCWYLHLQNNGNRVKFLIMDWLYRSYQCFHVMLKATGKKNYWQSETLVIVNLENVHPFSWLFFVGWLFFFIMHIILYCNILSLRLSGATVSSYWKLWTGLDRNSSWVDLGSSDWWPLFLLTGWEWTRVWCCVHNALGAWDTVICSWMSVIINLNHETHCTS